MKLAHVADLHLGFRQYGLESRKKAFEAVFQQMCRTVVELKADALVIAGDLFEKDIRSSTLEEMVRREMDGLRAAGVEPFGIEGNHDRAGDGSTLRICGITPLCEVPVMCRGFALAGLDYCGRASSEKIKEKVAGLPKADVLVMHQMLTDVAGALGGDISVDDLVGAALPRGVRYIAMGDAHNAWMTCAHGVPVVYPGSLEMTDVDERPDKHFVIAEISKDAPAKVTEIPVAGQRLRRVVLDTEEDCRNLLELSKTEPESLYYLSVSRDLVHMTAKLESALRGRGTAVTVRSHAPRPNGVAAEIKPFERASASANLVAVIDEILGAGTEKAGLARDLAERPDRMIDICDLFIRSQYEATT